MDEFEKLKTLYTKSYIDPTKEGIARFLLETSKGSYETSKPGSQINQSLSFPAFKKINISHTDAIYPSQRLTNAILQNNLDIYSKITNSIQNSKYIKIRNLNEKMKMLNQKN